MMRVVTLIAGKILFGSIFFVPETVNPSMDVGLPVPVSYPVTFTTEQDRLIFGNDAAVMTGECIRMINMVAVQASQI